MPQGLLKIKNLIDSEIDKVFSFLMQITLEFLNHYRIKEACALLDSKEDLTFQEIAYRMGYQSVATFNRAFKKETGVTPTEYRKNQGA